jgi:hypothetical protein
VTYDLAEQRALILARRSRAAVVAERIRAHHEEVSSGAVPDAAPVAVRCQLAGHRGGKLPKLAEIYLTRHGALFAARIEWAPADQLTLPPWERERYLGTALDDATLDRYMTDDNALSDWLTHLDHWQQGHQATGDRWLGDSPPSFIHEVLSLPDHHLGRRALWTRCPRHQSEAKELSPQELLATAR